MKNRAVATLLLFLLAVPAWAGDEGDDLLAGTVCGKDLDGDGLFDGERELLACVNGVCLHDLAVCTTTSSEPFCPGDGLLDTVLGVCHLPADSITCPDKHTYDESRDLCVLDDEGCPECVRPATYDCPSGYSWVSLLKRCETEPTCPEGSYNPDEVACHTDNDTCPHGDYACVDMDDSGVNKCSPHPCFDLSAPGSIEEDEYETITYENDGTIDPTTGLCSGQFLIFNGRGGECLPSGVRTWFFNCCNPDPGSWLFFTKACPDESLTTAQAIHAGVAHYIGDYCKTKLPFIGCIQKARVYCRFNSKLARIIHQQGRPQLNSFGAGGGWGTAAAPVCRGLTPEEFQLLDFSKIDLGEFFGDISPVGAGGLLDKAQEAVINFQDSLR